MTPRAAPFVVIDAADLPEYPIPVGTRLDGHSWFQFHHAWFQASDFRRKADPEVRAVWIDLLCAAQGEDPVGSLPTEASALAWKARIPLERWMDLAGRETSPLYGWQRCVVSDGRVRLFHPKLLQVTESAARAKLEAAARRAGDRERKRLAELPGKVLAAGGSQRMAQDASFIAQLDDHLQRTLPEGTSRTVSRVREAMEALSMG